MKRIVLLLFLSVVCLVSVNAQERKFVDKTAIAIDKVRVGAGKLRYNVEGMLKLDNGQDESGDLIRLKGFYYMPIYDVNIYKGKETTKFCNECRKKFAEQFPSATIQTVVIPQTDWVHEVVKQKKRVVGYLETMYCYIVAKDGDDGFINARFSFKQYKDVGDPYGPLVDNWPKFERVDFLTPELYERIRSK